MIIIAIKIITHYNKQRFPTSLIKNCVIVYNDYENRNIVIDGQHIPLDRNTLLSMGHRWGSSGGRWVLHSTTKDSNGNYLYNPRDCYDYMKNRFKNPKKQKAVCDESVGRIINLNK